LKEVAKVGGIDKRITSHLARHTFATTIALSKGMPIESVSKMLGHTSIKTKQIYARILNSKISSDMDVLAEKLKDTETKFVTN
jgi:site-specific recombinase XerD